MELEDGYIIQQEKIKGLLQSDEKKNTEMETHRNAQLKELNAIIEDPQRERLSLQESLSKEREEKLVAIKSFEEEAEARATSENLKVLQETMRLQEYNTSLQQYNINLQADAVKNGETVSRLQKEKSAMMETLTGLRDHANLLKNQLDSSRKVKESNGNKKRRGAMMTMKTKLRIT